MPELDMLTDRAITIACDADRTVYGPFLRLTRADTAVGERTFPTLHGDVEPFDLWQEVAA